MRSGTPGDEFIHLDIKTPKNLSRKQKELLENYRSFEADGENVFQKFRKSFRK
jgi:DnaJ-class molecular chaperone